jgi:type III restriction enzyme
VNFQLKGYQTDATADVVEALQEGFARYEKSGKLTAVSLSAPTGAGKTVIATAVIEQLLFGDEGTAPNPDLTILWVTDDPSLNQQTKRKMLLASKLIRSTQLVSVGPTLDQQALDPGKVYFVHIQQLGKGSTNYVKTGDKRQYTLWGMIGTTIATRGQNFLLIIDEAHKGTSPKPGGSKTITAQLIDGAGGTFPPTPVVLGISATPERFVEAISKAGQRTLQPVVVDAEEVHESGLLKDKIRIKHPTDSQPGDSTLLEMAVADLKAFDRLWGDYAVGESEPGVTPALVIQVKAKASEVELKATIDTLANAWSILDGKAIGHAFQEHTTLNLGTRTVRYVAPQDIQDDPHLRVVLFKEALTTGWDCPRAEVMLSFRSAQDYTYIAQLIGRMVRTPLARRIATDDVLNTVALYLPYYADAQVAQVVAGLQSDESTIISKVEVDAVTCPRNAKVPEAVWDIMNGLPTYTRPGRHHRSDVARLNALATLLVGTDLDPEAIDKAQTHITDTLGREATRLGSSLAAKVADFEKLDYQTQTVDLETGSVEKEAGSVLINARNIDDLFRRARRSLGDAAAKWYWDLLCDSGTDADEAKVTVAALAADSSVAPALEAAAKTLVDAWRTQYNGAISRLPDSKRALFYNIWQQSKAAEQVTIIMPIQITAPDKDTRHAKHVYANGKGLFPATFTGWEADVLAAELDKTDSLVAWYRNPTGGTSALAVPYEQSGVARTMYPDFLFFHDVDGETVVDLVDPHRPDAGDTGPKWTGLAAYATKHAALFRRIAAVIKNGDGHLVSVDLKNADVAARCASARNETDIRKVFADFGGAY